MNGLKLVFVAGVLSAVLGCGQGGASAPSCKTVTNVVTVTRSVTCTNRVTHVVVVTNTVVVEQAPVRILSARKTAPYRVSSTTLDAARLRKVVSDAGARVIRCDAGAVALIEASDRAVATLSGLTVVSPLSPEEKIAPDAGEKVKIVPLSSIDAAALVKAVRATGGDILQVVTVGQPCIRAKLSFAAVRQIAARGDVRRVERDNQK